jgi:hypothetical protein
VAEAARDNVSDSERPSRRLLLQSGGGVATALLLGMNASLSAETQNATSADASPGRRSKTLDTEYFKGMYATESDPWQFATSAYERDKYAATLAALPRSRYASALEVGCSIGVFTHQLCPRCDTLLGLVGRSASTTIWTLIFGQAPSSCFSSSASASSPTSPIRTHFESRAAMLTATFAAPPGVTVKHDVADHKDTLAGMHVGNFAKSHRLLAPYRRTALLTRSWWIDVEVFVQFEQLVWTCSDQIPPHDASVDGHFFALAVDLQSARLSAV